MEDKRINEAFEKFWESYERSPSPANFPVQNLGINDLEEIKEEFARRGHTAGYKEGIKDEKDRIRREILN